MTSETDEHSVSEDQTAASEHTPEPGTLKTIFRLAAYGLRRLDEGPSDDMALFFLHEGPKKCEEVRDMLAFLLDARKDG